MATICSTSAADWEIFFRLAAGENWRISAAEQRLFQGAWAQFAHTLDFSGSFAGLVTAVPHQRSGWIGNLLVPPPLRGLGYGRQLFTHALQQLAEHGIESCWLTASAQGQPLYESCGFIVIDQIERWILRKRDKQERREVLPANASATVLKEADRAAWGEERTSLLTELTAGSGIFTNGQGVICLQYAGDFQLLGPWHAGNGAFAGNRLLLTQALKAADPQRDLLIDLIASSPLRELLAPAGFLPMGRSALMVRGTTAARLDRMVALASLGSVG